MLLPKEELQKGESERVLRSEWANLMIHCQLWSPEKPGTRHVQELVRLVR